ncbi:MAG: HD domain-containing protein [Thermoguttaceae bacterium]|nr:HD domain-containing protein [Thermoguttaceae bacterium]
MPLPSENPRQMPIRGAFHEIPVGKDAVFFALLSSLEPLETRDGKPYWRVTFRDALRTVSQPIWNDSPWAELCKNRWKSGTFFKIRATLTENKYGLQLDIRQIREVEEKDAQDGFDPQMCLRHSRYDSERMFQELMQILADKVTRTTLRKTIFSIFTTYRTKLLTHPAAVHHHHAWVGGLLEHTLEVTRNGLFFAERYAQKYREMPSLDVDIVVAGAMIHDIGKLEELDLNTNDITFTPAGGLLGHLVIGVHMLRDAALATGLDEETTLRLEHIILSHQRLPEWGSPKPPMTPESLIIHYADDLDAKLDIMNSTFLEGSDLERQQPLTSKKNLLQYQLFRAGTPMTAVPEPETQVKEPETRLAESDDERDDAEEEL